MTPLFMGLGGPEIIFIVLIIMLLFGGKKIPELMKGIGKGVKSFKDGVSGLDEAKTTADTTTEAKPEAQTETDRNDDFLGTRR